MGVFGTSSSEESQLRSAAQDLIPTDSNDQSSYTGSSAYETADEQIEDDLERDGNLQQVENHQGDAGSLSDETIKDITALPSKPNIKEKGAQSSALNSVHQDNTQSIEPEDVQEIDPRFYHAHDPETLDENELNKRFTIERITSHKSIEEIADTDLRRSLSRKISVHKERAADEYSDASSEISISQLDWDGIDDKNNPQNWPIWKKWYITLTVALVCLCVSLGSSLYVSGVPELMIQFGASQELCLAGLTLYLVGLALGPVLTSPLSEIIGRRWIYLTSFPISILFAMGIGLSHNIHTILVLRFFCGYFASPALSIAGGTISDLWSNNLEDLSLSIALFCLGPFLGPVIGPIIGGFAAEYKDWKWAAAWVSMMFSGAILPFLVLVPETYKPILLKKRAEKRGIKFTKTKLSIAYFKTLIVYTLLRPVEMLFIEPIVCVMSIYIAFVFAVLFGFFEAFPIIFRGVYHMGLGVSGLPFIGVGLGLICGVFFYIYLDKTIYFPKNPDGSRGKRDENGNIIWDPPEKKLLPGKIGAVCLPISLFWLGWTGRSDSVHWMAPTVAGFPFGFGLILVFFSVILYFSMSFPPASVASAIAANNLLRYLLASVFPLFTVQMYDRLGIDWASSLFAFIALAMVPVPFVFEKFGPKLRTISKYGYAAYFKKLAEEKAEIEAKSKVLSEKLDTLADSSEIV